VKFVCPCGREIKGKPIHKCPCGRQWFWKRRSKRYVFAGWWIKNKKENNKPCGCV